MGIKRQDRNHSPDQRNVCGSSGEEQPKGQELAATDETFASQSGSQGPSADPVSTPMGLAVQDSVTSIDPVPSIGRSESVGKVFLVGAGPGDPGLVTVRGRQCLQLAEVVLYDGLANPRILDWAEKAECICVGKHGQSRIWRQAEINAKLVELAHAGKRIVRLKGGDPAVFARTAEELDVLSTAGIPFEVVPGITAALAAASYTGIPITHRNYASAVAFVTGQQQTSETPEPLDWEALAKFPGTLVFYMGVTTVQHWTSQLIGAGKAPDTPAAIIRRCSWSDQRVLRCRLDEVASYLTPASKLRPPVIVIVGSVCELGSEMEWVTELPLRGCGVLVTRAKHQAEELVNALEQLGAEVFLQPMFELRPPADMSSLDHAIDLIRQGEVDGMTFSSSNGVDGLMQRILQRELDVRILGDCCLAAVGPATAKRLNAYGLRADLVPRIESEFSSAGLLKTLNYSVAGKTWIVTTTNRSGDRLRNGLRQRGARVVEALAYETEPTSALSAGNRVAVERGRINLVTVTSASIAESVCQLLGEYRDQVRSVSLSPAISERLCELNWPPVAEAEKNTGDALTQAVQIAWQAISH